ncbi:uncharacterized protein LOC115442643 [Manduca sexta]|uniref:uncharacterized protein LOC115442643 n=1 Tax=Manduca sexta TaxID=7130 RepID=UPI00188FECA7|nr:uncharacterized protein LOC115442643 [Manduca sexta]
MHNIIQKLDVPTTELRLDVIQEVLIKVKQCRKIKIEKEPNLNTWDEICEALWMHLQTGLKNVEDELLCGTCFYSAIPYTDKQDYFLYKILDIIKSEIQMRTNPSLVVSLMYGMFQSSFFSHENDNILLITSVLEATIDLLLLMSYEYTRFTFLAFKTINSFKKVCGTKLEHIIFNNNNQIKLLNLVNHNWENPITGVRDLIRSIFQTTIKIGDDTIVKTVLDETNKFYWNKAKYLMLSEMIHCRVNDISEINENDWVEGLVYSLHKPGLVSAGSDMYYVILKILKSEEDWCSIFLSPIVKILEGESNKAIENFTNYWCLITFKTFPSLMDKLLNEIMCHEKSKLTFYSILCLMKQGNKLGLLKKYWKENDKTTNIIVVALNHNSNHVRIMAFDIVCMRNEKSLPSQMEYNLLLDFLKNNVNTDSTVLRLAMLGSFKHFLTQVHIAFINYIHKSSKEDVNNFVEFCKSLQEFILDSFSFNGNYQRKITIVKLTNNIMNCFCEVPRKRKDQTKQTSVKLIGYLTDKKAWALDKSFVLLALELLKDPTNDIRENVIQLLVNHFSDQFMGNSLLHDLKEKALISMKSKFFYEIDCGRDMLKLLINILLKQNLSDNCPQYVEDIFYAACNQLIIENKLKKNIMKSIENGTQLHSFISILYVVIEACILNSCKIKLSEGTMMELLNALEDIANQFTWEEQSSTSSDFSKMNEMVENIIIQSGYDFSKESNESKISGQHQIVLNCLWLNVKACCDLTSLLIRYNSEDMAVCEKSLNILTHVLETSRHKGAIESAGAALGQAIQHLSSQSEESNASKLPYILLKSKLNILIQQASNMASITRRGAGLSIMVHRIVSSDMKKGKPLFTYFMDKLLEACDKVDDIPKSKDIDNIENQVDLPKAIYIHFLTKIVTDSSLATDVTYYSSKLAQLGYNNLTSPHWQIRNAALQLYGALVPRQIGQKKASGIDEETIATVAYDELRTHSPKLWSIIINQLKNENNCDKLQSHSNLVSILNLLANSAKRYNFSFNMLEGTSADEELLEYFVLLLGSPIFTVRRLTAKCIFNIYTFETIYKILINLENLSENSLHGHLTLMRQCHKYYTGSMYKPQFSKLQARYSTVFTTKNHSYMCKELFDDMFLDNVTLNDVTQALEVAHRNLYKAGIDTWVNTIIQKYLLFCSWTEVPQMLQVLMDTAYFEKGCEYIIMKLKSFNKVSECTLTEITNTILLYKYKYGRNFIWKILYLISLEIQITHIDIAEHLKGTNEDSLPYNMRYLLPLAARVVAIRDIDLQLKLAKIIHNLTNPQKVDVDMRHIAALANNEMASIFDNLCDNSKVLLIKSAVNLLQDEDEDVRYSSVIFYKTINKLEMPLNPYICLQRILDPDFLKDNFMDAQNGINILCNDLSVSLQTSQCGIDEYNPFANDSKNIYLENEVLKRLIEKLKTVAF